MEPLDATEDSREEWSLDRERLDESPEPREEWSLDREPFDHRDESLNEGPPLLLRACAEAASASSPSSPSPMSKRGGDVFIAQLLVHGSAPCALARLQGGPQGES